MNTSSGSGMEPVSILVLVDLALEYVGLCSSQDKPDVSILVLVDLALEYFPKL